MKKKISLMILVLAAMAAAQTSNVSTSPLAQSNVVERIETPTDSDLYCSGFVTNQPVSRATLVSAGLNYPHSVRYSGNEPIFLVGSGIQEGAQFLIVRQVRDPNEYEPFRNAREIQRRVGEPYAEMGKVTITKVRSNVGPPVGIARFDLSCDTVAPGDIAIPFVARPRPSYRRPMLADRFAPRNGLTTGFIVGSKDFDLVPGTNHAVYLSVGANQGVSVGDYFRAVRSYVDEKNEPVESLSFKPDEYDDNQKIHARWGPGRVPQLPRRLLGEMIVVNVTPSSSTAIITTELEQIRVGEGVEKEPPAPPIVIIPPAPPRIHCAANPDTVRAGDPSTVTCSAISPDNRPLRFAWSTSRGILSPRQNISLVQTRNLVPGPISITTTAIDDRDLKGYAVTTINVVATSIPATATLIADLAFKHGSARVDNRAKAQLDDVALRMQRDPNSKVLIVGETDPSEASSLAAQRARNAAQYLIQSRGIDPSRILTRSAPGLGARAQVWIVPAGAALPTTGTPTS